MEVNEGLVDASETEGAWSPTLARLGLSAGDAGVLFLVGLFVVAYFPPFFFESWTPRAALLLAVLPMGLLLLARSCVRGDRASLVLCAALIWAAFCSIVGDAPRSSLLGFAGRDLSTVTVVGSAGLWQVGRMVTSRGRDLVPAALVAACAFVAGVGILQVIVSVDSGPLSLLYGRPTGLVSSPVYFGALSAAGAATALALWTAWDWRTVLSLSVTGVATTLSGSRVALLAVLVVAGTLLATQRSRERLVAAAVLGASLASGVLLDRILGSGYDAASRLGAVEGSADGRFEVWRYGLSAFAERPIVGYGFGQFRPAVQHRFTADFVRENAPDELTQAWFDPHNVGVTLLVSVGLIGAVLFAVWVVMWARQVRGPLVAGLAVIGLHWLLQPLSLYTLPLAMLLFGVAGGAVPGVTSPRIRRAEVLGASLTGLLLASLLIVSDLRFASAIDNADPAQAATVSRWFWNDPVVADVVARLYALEVDSGEDVLEWRQQVVEFEPDRPLWWSALAELQFDRGLDDEAEDSIRAALRLQPYNLRSQRVEVLLALRARDELRLRDALDLACVLGQSDCDIDAAELIEELDP